jgi:hypothetical protein
MYLSYKIIENVKRLKKHKLSHEVAPVCFQLSYKFYIYSLYIDNDVS